jgi:hypothetical protein
VSRETEDVKSGFTPDATFETHAMRLYLTIKEPGKLTLPPTWVARSRIRVQDVKEKARKAKEDGRRKT